MAEKDMLDIFEGMDFFAGFQPDPQAVKATENAANEVEKENDVPDLDIVPQDKIDANELSKMEEEAVQNFKDTIAEDTQTEQSPVAAEEETPVAETPVVEEPKKKRGRPRKKKEEEPAEEKIEEAPIVATEASTEEHAPIPEEDTDQKVEENVKTSKKKKAEVIVPAGEAAKENTVTVTITTSQTYRDIINALNLLPPVDENFLKIKDEIQEKMNAIRVQEGMTRALVEHMSEKIDELNFLINGNLAAMKTAYENLANKDDGILARVMAKGGASGTNEVVRKANGIKAAEEFISPSTKEKVDLFWAVYATRYAKNFYEAASEQLENKRRLLKQQADFIMMKAA